MPRKVEIPSYRLHKGTGQAVVTINGRDIYFGVHGSPESKTKYREIVRRRAADKIKAEMATSVRLHVDLTVAELAARYLVHVAEYYKKGGRPTTQVSLITSAINVVLDKYSHLEVTSFGPLVV